LQEVIVNADEANSNAAATGVVSITGRK